MEQENIIKEWLTLSRCRGVKPETIKNLATTFKSPAFILAELERIQNTSTVKKRGKLIIPNKETIDKELDLITKNACKCVHLQSEYYPELMKTVFSTPIFFTCKGDIELLKKPAFSVVGSRMPLISSVAFTKQIVPKLCNANLVISSGMAMGIDTTAHEAALTVGGETIGILSNGIDTVYPAENKNLYARMIENGGLLIGEFEFSAEPISYNFPRRNLSIAAIAYAILIVEAKLSSGSLLTADYARIIKRPIFAVPGFPSDERHEGTNRLIKQGIAKMASNIDDILDEIKEILNNYKVDKKKTKSFVFENKNLQPYNSSVIDKTKKLIISTLSSTPVSLVQITQALQIDANTATISLLELEIDEIVTRTFDGSFVLDKSNNQGNLYK